MPDAIDGSDHVATHVNTANWLRPGIHGQSIFISTEHDSVMVVQSSATVADGDFFEVAASYFAAATNHFAAR
jgi:hypothetical protein